MCTSLLMECLTAINTRWLLTILSAILSNIYNSKLKDKCIKNLKTSSGIGIMGILKYKPTNTTDSND